MLCGGLYHRQHIQRPSFLLPYLPWRIYNCAIQALGYKFWHGRNSSDCFRSHGAKRVFRSHRCGCTPCSRDEFCAVSGAMLIWRGGNHLHLTKAGVPVRGMGLSHAAASVLRFISKGNSCQAVSPPLGAPNAQRLTNYSRAPASEDKLLGCRV